MSNLDACPVSKFKKFWLDENQSFFYFDIIFTINYVFYHNEKSLIRGDAEPSGRMSRLFMAGITSHGVCWRVQNKKIIREEEENEVSA
jgi:hypothetical protein